jgi:hypothetical protein
MGATEVAEGVAVGPASVAQGGQQACQEAGRVPQPPRGHEGRRWGMVWVTLRCRVPTVKV